ncbi:MAG: hypothetical protein V3T17_19350 [Pseudomonadales bacterium]
MEDIDSYLSRYLVDFNEILRLAVDYIDVQFNREPDKKEPGLTTESVPTFIKNSLGKPAYLLIADQEIITRIGLYLISTKCDLSIEKLSAGTLAEEDWPRLTTAISKLKDTNRIFALNVDAAKDSQITHQQITQSLEEQSIAMALVVCDSDYAEDEGIKAMLDTISKGLALRFFFRRLILPQR